MSDKVELFYALHSPADVATLLGISYEVFAYRLYLLSPKYIEFEIPKNSGGTRKISAPHPALKLLQITLNEILQEIYEPRPSVHGFVTKRGIVTNARAHKRQKYVLNIDLKDFFPSIHFGRVRGLFMAAPFNLSKEVATVIARICCIYDGLPQGAPTSPVISNMICRRLDGELQLLAKRHQCFYTRYADDITFSTSKPVFPESLAKTIGNTVKVGEILEDIIRDNGFKINHNKVRLQNRHQRQEVTGLTVNRFPNVNRRFINQIRAMLHDLEIRGDEAALERHLTHFRKKHRNPERGQLTSFRDIVRGKIEFLGQVRGHQDEIYHGFLRQLGIDKHVEPLIFINYASDNLNEVQKIYDFLELSFSNLWMDKTKIGGGAEWWGEITKAIDEASIFIACLSEETIRSQSKQRDRRVVHKEVDYALEKYTAAQEDGRIATFTIIPLLIHEGIGDRIRQELKALSYIEYYEGGGNQRLKDRLQELVTRLKS